MPSTKQRLPSALTVRPIIPIRRFNVGHDLANLKMRNYKRNKFRNNSGNFTLSFPELLCPIWYCFALYCYAVFLLCRPILLCSAVLCLCIAYWNFWVFLFYHTQTDFKSNISTKLLQRSMYHRPINYLITISCFILISLHICHTILQKLPAVTDLLLTSAYTGHCSLASLTKVLHFTWLLVVFFWKD